MMSDGVISQDEIEALLSGVPVDSLNDSGQVSSTEPSAKIDTAVLSKFASDLSPSFAENLKQMTGANVEVANATAESVGKDQFLAKMPDMVIVSQCAFSGGLKGEHLYLLSHECAQKLVGLINKEENAELDEMALSVVSEALSTHTNDEITALDKTGKLPGLACDPAETSDVPKAMVKIPQNTFALFSFPVKLDGDTFTIWEVVDGEAAWQIGLALGGGVGMDSLSGMLGDVDMASLNAKAASSGGPMPVAQMGGMGTTMNGMNAPNVQSVQFQSLSGTAGGTDQGNIGLLMDVYMEMTVELGRTKKPIKEILGFGEGTIIELDKLAGEAVDILVNHKAIAKGEVVVIDENFGVRITEILSPQERVSELR